MARSRRPSEGATSWSVDGIRVEINETKLGVVVRRDMSDQLEKILDRIRNKAKVIVRARFGKYQYTGAAEGSIETTRVKKVNQYAVAGGVTAGGPKAPHARYLHEGAAPHIIRARPENPTGLLRFVWTNRQGRVITAEDSPEDAGLIGTRRQLGNQLVLTPSVHHPGIRHPVPFLVMAGGSVTGIAVTRRG